MRPSVRKWPRASRGMLRLRGLACATVVSLGAARRWAVVAAAGGGVMWSAICAINRPRPIMMAAMVMMLRITPHSVPKTCRYHHAIGQTATNIGNGRVHFGEKDERSVNAHVPRGFTRRVGIALAGSSGQGCRG